MTICTNRFYLLWTCELVNSWTAHITTNNITKWKIIMQGWQNNLIKLLYNIYYYNNIYYIIINMWIFLIFGNWFCYVVSCYVGRFCRHLYLPTEEEFKHMLESIEWSSSNRNEKGLRLSESEGNHAAARTCSLKSRFIYSFLQPVPWLFISFLYLCTIKSFNVWQRIQ